MRTSWTVRVTPTDPVAPPSSRHVVAANTGAMAEPTGWSAWNAQIIEADKEVVAEFRARGGQVGGYFAGAPMLLLHHIGARTGVEHVNPLVYVRDGDDLVVAASKGGAPDNPDWYRNLTARPRVSIELGTEPDHRPSRPASA